MLSLYVPGDSVVHRVPAGLKLFILVIGSMALFVISNIPVHVAELLVIAVFFRSRGFLGKTPCDSYEQR